MAQHDLAFADRHITEVRHIPMWSNIFNNKFDSTNRRPNSTASVECEIKKIKINVLAKKGKTTRVDATVEKIMDYYDGLLRNLSVDGGNKHILNNTIFYIQDNMYLYHDRRFSLG